MKKALMLLPLLAFPAHATTYEGTVLDVKALTRDITVNVPYSECKTVPETVRFNHKGYMGFTDGPLQRIFNNITAPTGTIYVNRCETVHRKETKTILDGYLITYTFNHKVYQTRTKIKPKGNKIQIRIRHEVK